MTLEVFYLLTNMKLLPGRCVPDKALLMAYVLFLRHGDGSNDTVAEHNPREERLPLQGWCASLCAFCFQSLKHDSHSVKAIVGTKVIL